MKKLKQLSVGNQVLLTFGALCLLLLIRGGVSFFSLQSIDRSNQLQLRAMKKLALIDDVAQDVGQMQAQVLREVLASDTAEINHLDQTIRDIEKISDKELAGYQKIVETEKEKLLYEKVVQVRKAYWEHTQPVLALGLKNLDTKASELITSTQAPAYDALLKAVNELIKHVETSVDETAAATARFISIIKIISNVFVSLTILIVIGTGFAIARIARRLKEDNRLLQINVAEQEQAEETLRESEEKFRQLADNITDVFWICSPDFTVMHYVSPGYERIWGRSMESLYANPHQWIEAILPEERKRAFAAFAPILGNEPEMSVEYQIARPDGTVRWIHDRGFQVRNVGGKLVRLAGIASDITERKTNEESLRLLNSAVEQSKEPILITDAELDLPGPKIIFVNPAFTQMTGYAAEEVIGKTPRILQGPHTDRNVLSRLRKNLERGEVFEGETLNYRKDGKEFNLEWQIAPIRNASGKITNFVALQRDITERKRLEFQLVQSQKLETVGKLAGGIAHEFNSILTAIIGQSELLIGDLPAGSPLATNATEISKAAGRAATLTRQLLAYGRKQLLQPEDLDLNRVVAGMESIFHQLIGRAVEMHIVAAIGLQVVKADAGQIEQVIMNMIINARDAMPNGGKLILETANVSFDQNSVGRYPELKPGDYVMLAITDTGIGMSEEMKMRLFEPFFSTKGIGRGTGLGLSTCYGIIKQSGGHISVYSELGRGTTFKIYLPQVEPQAKSSVQLLDSPDLPRGTETILLVEDDPALREMAATLLRRLGYIVLTAANGVEAMSLKHERSTGYIDLLFTEVVMPHMNGKELAGRVQALYPHTRILFTSAHTENANVYQGVLDPDVPLLQKPFTPSALAHKLREVLDQPNMPS